MDGDVGHLAHGSGKVRGRTRCGPERHLQSPARIAHAYRCAVGYDTPTGSRGSGRHTARAAGEGLPGAPLPPPEIEKLAPLVLSGGDPFDVDATFERGLELGAELCDVDGSGVGPQQD